LSKYFFSDKTHYIGYLVVQGQFVARPNVARPNLAILNVARPNVAPYECRP
jgi:hypothetical protein